MPAAQRIYGVEMSAFIEQQFQNRKTRSSAVAAGPRDAL